VTLYRSEALGNVMEAAQECGIDLLAVKLDGWGRAYWRNMNVEKIVGNY
jgi:hypothetical protein